MADKTGAPTVVWLGYRTGYDCRGSGTAVFEAVVMTCPIFILRCINVFRMPPIQWWGIVMERW